MTRRCPVCGHSKHHSRRAEEAHAVGLTVHEYRVRKAEVSARIKEAAKR